MMDTNYSISINEVPRGFDVRVIEKHPEYFLAVCIADEGVESLPCDFSYKVSGYAR